MTAQEGIELRQYSRTEIIAIWASEECRLLALTGSG
jgi:hypothetical protein